VAGSDESFNVWLDRNDRQMNYCPGADKAVVELDIAVAIEDGNTRVYSEVDEREVMRIAIYAEGRSICPGVRQLGAAACCIDADLGLCERPHHKKGERE